MITLLAAMSRHRGWYSGRSLLSIGSLFSPFSVLSIGTAGSILAIGGAGKRRGQARPI
jgi:hypothetical protein